MGQSLSVSGYIKGDTDVETPWTGSSSFHSVRSLVKIRRGTPSKKERKTEAENLVEAVISDFSAPEPLELYATCSNLAAKGIPTIKGSTNNLITCAHSCGTKGFKTARTSSLGAYASATNTTLVALPEGSTTFDDGPCVLHHTNFPFGEVGSVFVIESGGNLDMTKVMDIYSTLRENCKRLIQFNQNKGEQRILVPLLGYNPHGNVPMVVAVQEVLSFAYYCSLHCESDLKSIGIVCPTNDLMEQIEQACEAHTAVISELENLIVRSEGSYIRDQLLLGRLKDWYVSNGEDVRMTNRELVVYVENIINTWDQHIDKPLQHMGAEVSFITCENGLNIAEAYMAQWTDLPIFETVTSMSDRIHFLRYLRLPRTCAQYDECVDDQGHVDGVPPSIKPFINDKIFISLLTLNRLGLKTDNSNHSGNINIVDGLCTIQAIIHIVGTLGKKKQMLRRQGSYTSTLSLRDL